MECQRCGNCCPTDCEYLVIEKEEPRLTRCEVHDAPERRGFLCHMDPVRYYMEGIACRANQALIGEKPTVRRLPGGQIVYK